VRAHTATLATKRKAHTPLQTRDRRGCRLVSSSSLLHEPATPTSPKNDHQGRPRHNGLMNLISAYAKQMTLHTRLAALILKMSSEEDICKTCAKKTITTGPPATGHHRRKSATATLTSEQGWTNAKARRTCQNKADYQSHCRDQIITHHRCRCRASHHAETPHCPSGTCRPQCHVHPAPRSTDGSNFFKKTPQRRKPM
jgi:hypothetical protein